jgi:NADH-quinone oxidoreductase subunit N
MLLAALKNGHQMWLVILAVLCAAVSAYYYFKVIQAMYFKEAVAESNQSLDITPAFKWLLVITAALIIILGVIPGIIIDWLYY